MKDLIFKNWNIVRFLRLGIGLAILIQAIMAADILFGLAGLLFTATALFNSACCGVSGCETPKPRKKYMSKDISYEELV